MGCRHTVLGCMLVLAGASVAGGAVAQADGGLRWRTGVLPLGLHASPNGFAVPCSTRSVACSSSAVVPLYASKVAPRSLSMQLDAVDNGAVFKTSQQGLSLSVLGRAAVGWDLGVYGRIGATWARASGAGLPEGGISYGVGLSWDFSRSATAVLGWDSHDVRGPGGEPRDVRSTSLGLQVRY